MGVPATGGVIRTRVADMQIGDYISCRYVATSNVFGKFTELGVASGAEIPLNGALAPNGVFYYVKADRGLLIADRVVQNKITWAVLNNAGGSQGILWGNIIPPMTSYNTPSGLVSYSNTDSANGPAWKAFNNTMTGYTDRWYFNGFGSGQWIQYQFASQQIIKCYDISAVNGDGVNSVSRAPKDFQFYGSNDGVNFTLLDARYGELDWSDGCTNTYFFANDTPFLIYRLNVSALNPANLGVIEIGELRMYTNTPYILRSLSGGVAYADPNGNVTYGNAGYGCFPTTNEWDKYIVYSDLNGKILRGDNNVWHWNDARTWSQDTPSINFIGSTYRTVRGGFNDVRMFDYPVQSNNTVDVGFRPVLRYKDL
jgi:hypothetical protein